MFTTDPRVRKLVSDSHVTFNFNPLPILCNSRALLLFSLRNYACASKEGQELTFRKLMSKMNEESQEITHVTCDHELADPEALVQVNEWVLTSIASLIAHDNVDLHATLRRDITSLTPMCVGSLGTVRLDILRAIALMEVLCPVKYVIFSAEHGAM